MKTARVNEGWRFLGDSAPIREILASVNRLLPRLGPGRRVPPILLQGETGTGKGLLARTIHEVGPRSAGPFVDLNCAAIPATLIEAELFGFERGAFTDARQARTGLVEAAHGGTLFMDEIGLLPESLQAKLLTVLETREVRPLGGTRARVVDVSIIATTNSDLREAVRERRFREDLYHRLAVLVFSLPPLRDRGDDVLELAEAFLGRACADHALQRRLGDDARAAIAAYRWPGNVRELANLMERVALFTEGPIVSAADLALPPGSVASHPSGRQPSGPLPLKASVDIFTRARLEQALTEARGNISAAADRLGVPRSTLRYQIERFGLTQGGMGRARRRTAPVVAPLSERVLARPEKVEGERRQVSVLFADFTASMDRLAGGDPAARRALLDPVVERMIDAIRRHEGSVIHVRADGLMALFGAPVAHEDHAVRACYAALSMHESVGQLAQGMRSRLGADIEVRIGIHSGNVALRVIGNEVRLDYAAIPETTHVAARMEQAARPGGSLITAETLRLAESFIEVDPAALAGAYELRAPSIVRSRLSAVITRSLTQFVGRKGETTQIHAAMDRARGGRGQVVALVGDPGVGKSRLTWEVMRSAPPQGWLVLVAGSVTAATAAPYGPLADLLRGYLGIDAHQDVERVRETVSGTLHRLGEDPRALATPLLALVDVPVDDPAWQRRDPERRRQIFDAARRVLLRESQVRPVMVVVDDLQWIDAETHAFLDLLVESLPAARVLLFANYRPEAEHGWSRKTYYTQIRLDPLSAPSAGELLDTLMGADPALDALKRLLIERTEGNPFFLEESVRTLAESGALIGRPGTYQLGGETTSVQVPARVESVLMARIDRLSSEDKRLAQTAAVIGKDVPLSLLRLTVDRPDDEIHQGLARLRSAELLYEVGLHPQTEYTFKHALTHQVTYGSLLETTRRALHERIAQAMEKAHPVSRDAQPQVVAHHFTEAGLPGRAVPYWRRATRKASASAAFREAIRYGSRGLDVLAGMPETAERNRQELDLRLALVLPLQLMKGYCAPELESLLHRVRELCDRVDGERHLARVIGAQWLFYNSLPDLPRALELAQEHAALPSPAGTHPQVYSHGILGQTLRHMGRFADALCHAEAAIALYDHAEHHIRAVGVLGHNVGPMCLSVAAHALWALGYPDRARARLQEMLDLARSFASPSSLAFACMSAAQRLWLWRHDDDGASAELEEGARIAAEHGFAPFLNRAIVGRGWLLVRRGRVDEGIALLREGLDRQRPTGVMLLRVSHLALLAEAYGLAGSPGKGLVTLDEAFELMERGGERHFESMLHCVRGDLLLARDGDMQAAEVSRFRALAVAREQRAKSFELRAALGLARLWQRQGRRTEAHELLCGIYGWFTEGFDTADLREAKFLLDELRVG